MTFALLAAAALGAGTPLALVGPEADAADPVAGVAASLGMRVVRLAAASVLHDDVPDHRSRDDAPVLALVLGCSRVGPDGDDALLDLAFDGHPSLPAGSTVALCFDEPTELSEALADDAVPCALLSPDMRAPDVSSRVADAFGPASTRGIALARAA